MKKTLTIIALLTFSINIINAQESTTNDKEIHWVSMTKALEMSKTSDKKILIDFYTDWCGWCKRMDKATYENPKVIQAINKYFIPVKFNAEREVDITFKGRKYTIKKQGIRGTHELAVALLNGKMGYPTTTLLDKDDNMIQNLPGYIEADQMYHIVNYFGNDYHKKLPFKDYIKSISNTKSL